MKKLFFVLMLILSVGIMYPSWGQKKSAIESYEWLEGEWEGHMDEEWGKIIITPNTYKMVYSNSNKNIDEIASAEEMPISIRNEDSFLLEREMLALDKDNPVIGINVPQKQLYIILSQYQVLYLQKKDKNKLATTENNMSKTYGWDDDRLQGKVKRVVESSVDYDDKDWGKWEITKEYDSYGRICYIKRDQNTFIFSSQIYPMGFPIHEKNGGIHQYSALYTYGRFLNPLHMVGYDASRDRQHMLSGDEYTFDYNDKGLINNIYCNNKLINKCEYDEQGRLTKRYENNLPTLKIEWDKNSDNIDRTSFEIKWFNTSGQLIKKLPCKWNSNTLKTDPESRNFKEYCFKGDILQGYKIYNVVTFQPLTYELSIEYRFLYYNNMLIIEVLNHNEDVIGTYNLTYNDFGYLTEYMENDGKTHFKWKYQYDDYGNWTKATKYKITEGEDIEFEEELNTITRKYVYYE